jgi:pimeloyl-ACP methyl ester carboxylesterase
MAGLGTANVLWVSENEKNEKDRPTIVFIHGWPDTPEIYERQVDYFKGKYRLLRIVLPFYSLDKFGLFLYYN